MSTSHQKPRYNIKDLNLFHSQPNSYNLQNIINKRNSQVFMSRGSTMPTAEQSQFETVSQYQHTSLIEHDQHNNPNNIETEDYDNHSKPQRDIQQFNFARPITESKVKRKITVRDHGTLQPKKEFSPLNTSQQLKRTGYKPI